MALNNLAHYAELTSPFKDALFFRSLSATESLGRLFHFDIEALSERNDLAAKEILGKTVTVSMESLGPDDTRHFHGYVTEFALVGQSGRHFVYRLVARPWLWMATRTADCRIFQEKSVPEIIKLIFQKYGIASFDDRLTQTFAPHEYCVQYRETDFNFVSRLMEQEGIYYFFEHHEDRHVMVLADAPSAHTPITGYEEILFARNLGSAGLVDAEVIDTWQLTSTIQPGAFVLDDYDFKRPQTALLNQIKDPKGHPEDRGEYFDYPGGYLQKDDGRRYAALRLEELHAQHEQASGAGNARGLAVGHLFQLTNYVRDDESNKEYLVVSSHISVHDDTHEAEGRGGPRFRCQFSAIPSTITFRAPRITPRPRVEGPQTAMVVGPAGDEIHTDEHGRVKVHFHWDRYGEKNENDSCWIRVSHPWAGQGWGAVSIPRIGQEVIVDFLEGDPDRPIVTGRVYNGDNRAPFPLPGGAVVSGIKSNTHKGSGYNELSMDDTAGSEKINIHAQFDMTTTVEHDDTQTVHNNRTIKVDGTHTETITGNTAITIESGTLNHDVAGNTATYHVAGDVTETFDSKHTWTVGSEQSVTVGAKRTTSISADDVLDVGANQNTTVSSNREASVGSNDNLTVGSNLDMTVGSNASLTAGSKITLTVGGSTIEIATASITITSGASSIKLDAMGVTVTAPKISLNG